MAEPYVYEDARGDKLAVHPTTGPVTTTCGATIPAPCVKVTAPTGAEIPATQVGDVARALLAAAGLGQLVVPPPDWPTGRDEVEHSTGLRIKVVRDAIDFAFLVGLNWQDALSPASHLAHAAFRAREYEQAEQADPSPAVREIARLVDEVEPDLREHYAKDAPEAIARALIATGLVKAPATTQGAGCDYCEDGAKAADGFPCTCPAACWNPDCPKAARRNVASMTWETTPEHEEGPTL
ncbi:hypothetical protein JOL79_11515 [Microbispora sp. RL4-1S]|uniref:Uncharacterized protein n=1 Tax=Microbispora oryzae TaxID=2806554 RepID=A0A941AJ05_9ACTN|nr:hypothetical protein [Microbispora oryzae]MBP2704442.1 hypothetical protein [Microbispora oryzae]